MLPFLGTVIIASILAGIGIAIGFVLIIVPGLILLTFWSLIVPSIVIGGEGVFGSFSKSWRTVRGYAWHVFGTYVLVFLILIVFDIVIGLILLFLPVVARNAISSIISGTLVAPFLALVVTLVYYRLTAAHEAKGGPGEAQWPPAGPDATYPGPGTEPGAAPSRGRATQGRVLPPRARVPPPRARVPPPRGRTSRPPGRDRPPPGRDRLPPGRVSRPRSPATPLNVSGP